MLHYNFPETSLIYSNSLGYRPVDMREQKVQKLVGSSQLGSMSKSMLVEWDAPDWWV